VSRAVGQKSAELDQINRKVEMNKVTNISYLFSFPYFILPLFLFECCFSQSPVVSFYFLLFLMTENLADAYKLSL